MLTDQILSYDGAQDKHKRMLDLARAGREERKKLLREAAKAEKKELEGGEKANVQKGDLNTVALVRSIPEV